MMNRTLTITLALTCTLVGSTLQALTADELYNHAQKAVRLLPEAGIKVHPYKGKTREDYVSALNLTADDEAKLYDYVHGTEVVDKELNASALQRWAPRIIGLLTGGFIGYKTCEDGPVALCEKVMGPGKNQGFLRTAAAISTFVLTNPLIALIANAIQRKTLGAKINALHRTAVELLIKNDTAAYKAKLATLRVMVILQRFVRSLLLGGAIAPAAVAAYVLATNG